MRSFASVFVFLLIACALAVVPTPPTALAASCEFVLGFKTLHDVIPDVVGACAANERHNPENGDALQETSKGMLVWRKSDNFTAFTDGYRTWVNGPNGLQRRLNTERFSWEIYGIPAAGVAPAATCEAPGEAVTFESAQVEGDGSVTWRGTVKNPCGAPTSLMVDVRAQASKDGPPLMDTQTIFVDGLAPDESRPISTRFPAATSTEWFTWRVAALDANTLGCLPADRSRCLTSDPLVASGLWALNTLDEGKSLLGVARDNGVRISRREIGANVLGGYSHRLKLIVISQSLDDSSAWVRGAILAHELQHAADDATGKWATNSAACYQLEESAFRRQAGIWAEMWQSRLPGSVDDIHAELNGVTVAVFRNPAGFARLLTARYASECSDQADSETRILGDTSGGPQSSTIRLWPLGQAPSV